MNWISGHERVIELLTCIFKCFLLSFHSSITLYTGKRLNRHVDDCYKPVTGPLHARSNLTRYVHNDAQIPVYNGPIQTGPLHTRLGRYINRPIRIQTGLFS